MAKNGDRGQIDRDNALLAAKLQLMTASLVDAASELTKLVEDLRRDLPPAVEPPAKPR